MSTVRNRLRSFKYAFQGLADLMRSQPNARIHLAAAAGVIAAGLFFDLPAGEWALLVPAIVMVFMAEAFNTAIEYLTDLVSPDFHPLAGKAKDVAAAGVLLAAAGAASLGILVFFPHVWEWFSSL